MCCLNALVLPVLYFLFSSFTYFCAWALKKVLYPLPNTHTHSSQQWEEIGRTRQLEFMRVRLGKFQAQRSTSSPHQQVLIFVPTLEIPWVYFHLGSLWCCQKGIKEKFILCHSFIRGQLWYSLKGFLYFHLLPNNRGSLLTNWIVNRKLYYYLSWPLAKTNCFHGKQMAKLDKDNLDGSCLSAKLFSNSNWSKCFSCSLHRGWCQHVAWGNLSQLSKDCSNGWVPSPSSQLTLLSTSLMFS